MSRTTTPVARPSPAARERARAILRESAAHTLAESTNPAADLRALAEQMRQSAGLATHALGPPPGPPPRPN